MDNEIKDILIKLLDGQTRLEGEITGIKGEITGIKDEITGMKDEMTRINGEITVIKSDITGLKDDVKKNSITLESIEKKMDIISEIQTAHKEQNERSFDNTDKLLEERADLIETATKSISKNVIEVKDSVDVLTEAVGKHEMDIRILKRKPV
jgi:chromosome segregation ATPase